MENSSIHIVVPMENSSIHFKSKKNLTDHQWSVIFQHLLVNSSNGKLKRGSLLEIAKLFSVHVKTISKIWRRGKAAIINGDVVDVSSIRPTRVGRKRVQIDRNEVMKVPRHHRTNIRSLSVELKLPKSTVHRRIKEESEKFYLLPEEDEPLHTCKSKRFITKVMFLAAVARPRFDTNQNEVFSGKIGIFPFTIKEPAKRSSKNRCAGTLETKAITQVTKQIIRSCMIEKVLLAIRSKWPRSCGTEIVYIQQDNARPHILPSDVEFVEASREDGFDIRLSCQPPSSPDMNVLDLGFFRAIQSLQHQEAPKNIDELVAAVEKSFNELTTQKSRPGLSIFAILHD
ncbi:hypothetical protein Vadar_009016 [Vaccinium darrowii]|uniref:Uncharacterized protein n=1 Tax=Vaccinium darrowii TaxID=229202 RepID=A0ACB7XGM9_9ERIC|nr:hypothetical protein Vadar_009016 [Vaccinium darrowii]